MDIDFKEARVIVPELVTWIERDQGKEAEDVVFSPVEFDSTLLLKAVRAFLAEGRLTYTA